MPTSIPSLITDTVQLAQLLQNVVNQFIVRPTGNPNLVGVGGFVFDVFDDESVSFASDITDHYIEDNTAVQDHIALRPVRFTLKGYIGELNDLLPQVLQSILQAVERVLTIIEFLPEFTLEASQAYESLINAITFANSAITQGESLYGLFTQKNTTATRQQLAYNYFYSLWATRQLITVETPYQIFQNMAIESVRATQNGETRIISDFSITLKQIRTVQSAVLIELPIFSPRVADMVFSFLDFGISSGVQTPVTLLPRIFNNSPFTPG